MKRKKILKAIANHLSRPIVRVIIYISGILLVLGLSGAFSDNQTITNTFLNIITSQDTLTLFFAGLLSLGVVKIMTWFDSYMEESLKIEDNHHKIITQYKKHADGSSYYPVSFADKQGSFLVLKHLRKAPVYKPENVKTKADKRALRRWDRAVAARNSVKDKQSKAYLIHAKRAERFLNGELCLCSLNMFANVAADTAIRFKDSASKHKLPSFIIAHADEILQAHKNSVKNNSTTVRLDDFSYENNTLTLNTSRSTYYHMLITNRCMDYKFANGLSIREVYEYEDEICPIERSNLSNQIGINGLLITNDNYVLVEKRGRKKITWKNKFAQSISLAMKLKDLNLDRNDVLNKDTAGAQQKIQGIIEKTLNDNFGLTPADYRPFQMCENFLGLARDLLEGGKPNLYFYVQTNCSAKDLKKKLQDNVKVIRRDAEETDERTIIASGKLDSDYYLIPFKDIEIDYHYRMFLNRKTAIRVDRKIYPRCGRAVMFWDKTKAIVSRITNPVLVRECGEALLVTLAYLELRDAFLTPKKEEKTNEQ